MKDFYAILGVSPKATQEEIRAAYLELSKSLHPDVNRRGTHLMAEVNEAYSTLKDPAKRKAYDLKQKVTEFPAQASKAAQNFVKPDGSVDLMAMLRAAVPGIAASVAPVAERLLKQHGITPTAATLEQVLQRFDILPKKRRARRAS